MKKIILSLALVIISGSTLLTFTVPQTVSAIGGEPCVEYFLTFPNWYRGLVKKDANSNCNIKSPSELNTADQQNGLSNFIWHVVLNVIEIGLMLAGYVAVAFILYGGFQYLTTQGAPDAAAKARTTILNAIIGLVISLVAVGVVNFVVTGLLK